METASTSTLTTTQPSTTLNPTSPPNKHPQQNTLNDDDDDDNDEPLDPKELKRLAQEQEEIARIWDIFAEEYHDIVAELPLEYQRTFSLLTELEDQQQAHTASLIEQLKTYLESFDTQDLPPEGTLSEDLDHESGELSARARDMMSAIAKAALASTRAAEDKVGLALGLYESVDRHIRRLDDHLHRYEDSLIIGLRAGTLPSHDAPSSSLKDPPGRTTSLAAIALGEKDAYSGMEASESEDEDKKRRMKRGDKRERERRRKRERDRRERKALEKKAMLEGGEVALSSDGLMGSGIPPDMPVDPNEPTYCYCNQVSFGSMVGCDNDDCTREWFHLGCVGLEAPPEEDEKWYCADCIKILGITTDKKGKLKEGSKKGGKRKRTG
ncbi:hypothetical protein T439DRAFT_330027 [Meredithblackwellia eburnea MCA 4105]